MIFYQNSFIYFRLCSKIKDEHLFHIYIFNSHAQISRSKAAKEHLIPGMGKAVPEPFFINIMAYKKFADLKSKNFGLFLYTIEDY